MFKHFLTAIFLCAVSLSCTPKENHPQTQKIICGANQTEKYLNQLRDKNIGIVANHTTTINQTHLVDSLLAHKIKITAIFAPEHGFRGTADAGEQIKDGKDAKTGIQVYSLYGKTKKPSQEMLNNIDLMIFDIQDVGARFYTYISTMHYVMEACAENNIPVLILDRPNPNGMVVDGPVLKPEFSSFVGMHPVPVAHGMTIAEYAQMINEEAWLSNGVKCNLSYVPCQNYKHSMKYSLPINPSPNLPNDRSIELYPSLCLFEATTLSVGRGTNMQFQIVGHPDLKGLSDFSFTPKPNQGSKDPKHKNTTCYGYDFRQKNNEFTETQGQINLSFLLKIYADFPDKTAFFKNPKFFDKLAGGSELRTQIENNKTETEIRASWEPELSEFKTLRKKYLIYE